MLFAMKNKDFVETYGSPVLKAKAARIERVSDDERALALRLTRLVESLEGIGIAAPQAGVSRRMAVFALNDPRRPDPDSAGEIVLIPRLPMAVVNPEIIDRSAETHEAEEGCLSVPGIYAPVIRPARVVFRGETLDGEKLEFECGGHLARLIQHELDHLDGISFVDRLTPEARRGVERDIVRLLRHGAKNNYRKSVIV